MRFKLIILFIIIFNFIHCREICDPLRPLCDDPTCGIPVTVNYFNASRGIPEITINISECESSDIQARFTECYDGKKTLFHYWKPPGTCIGMDLPPPVKDVPCELHCGVGEYFNETLASCQPCAAGTYSLGTDSVTFNKWEGMLPPQMFTECRFKYFYYGDECNAWRMQGSYIDSGDNRDVHNTHSELSYDVETFENSGVSFSYKVNGEENWDYFIFEIDGQEMLRESIQNDWKTVTFPLGKGVHRLSFIYSKDFSITQGEDMAKIREIEITGISNVVNECNICKAGTFSSEKASKCEICPENTFSDKPGSSSCTPCPPGMSSFPGSTECYLSDFPCVDTDYFFEYSDCGPDGKLTKTARWIEPVLCNTSHPDSVSLPEPTVEPCAQPTCYAGQEVVGYECKFCQDGYASKDGVACVGCEGGEFSTSKVIRKNIFTSMSGYRTGCSGICKSNGWRFGGSFMDSGIYNGDSISWIEFDVNAVEDTSKVELEYLLTCESGSLEIFRNNYLIKTINCDGCSKERKIFSIQTTEKGLHKYRINFHATSGKATELECNRAVIYSIVISGSDAGGNSECSKCKAGYFSNAQSSTCSPCKPGQYSNSGSAVCHPCPKNSISPSPASPKCDECGSGTHSNDERTKCIWDYGVCKFEVPQNENSTLVYEWLELTAQLKNKIYFASISFNLDGGENSTSICGTAYACMVRGNNVTSLGHFLSIEHIEKGKLQLKIDDRGRNNAEIMLVCNPEEEEPSVEQKGRQYWIYSPFACPLCQESDWTEQIGECINNVRKITYKKDDLCYRGVQKTGKEEPCKSSVKVSVWVAVAVIGTVALIVLSISVVGLIYWIKYRRLSGEFHRLIEDQDQGNEKL